LKFCPTERAVKNLANEGIVKGVHNVGDVMYDSVLYNAALARRNSTITKTLGLKEKTFYLATIHRAENTDDESRLAEIFDALKQTQMPVVVPLHPRTKKKLGSETEKLGPNVKIIEPVAYLDMLALEEKCRLILTDSGGVQKEAYWFAVPCITLRDETEWVELVEGGWNRLAGANSVKILSAIADAEKKTDKGKITASAGLYGNGHSAEKIVNILADPKLR
jgi:UDP-N-acetylglucosamine 2-epimerase